jgi:hypothetical protein
MPTRKIENGPDTSTGTNPGGGQADAGGATASTNEPRPTNGKIVSAYPRVVLYKVKNKKKKKKKKYTAGLKDLQRVAHGITDSSERLSRALSRGVVRYRKVQNKSARKKRDGGITDFADNLSKGASRGLRIASRAPYDFTRRVNTKPYTRFVRSTFGIVLSPFFR